MSLLDSLTANLKGFGEQLEESVDDRSGAYLLLSMDLKDSTALKSQDGNWPQYTRLFYDIVWDELGKAQDDKAPIANIWKYVGDEVLLYRRVRHLPELLDAVNDFHLATEAADEALAALQDKTGALELKVKATAWIARVQDFQPHDLTEDKDEALNPPNIVIRLPVRDAEQPPDFLGPWVDAGFRIAKASRPGFVTLGAGLAWLLLRADPGQDRIRLVGWDQHKGIWDGRHYPVLWYRPSWEDLKGTFAYDERLKDPLLGHALGGGELMVAGDLEHILRGVGWLGEAHLLLQNLTQGDDGEEGRQGLVAEEARVEVHAVAVCFREDGRLLVAQRSEGKSFKPLHWEFGCAQLAPRQDFVEALRDHYLRDFGAKIDIPDYRPFERYLIESRRAPGVIFAALVTNPDELEEKFSRSKHAEVRWVSPEKALAIPAEECMPAFHTTVQRAVSFWQSSRATSDHPGE